MKPRFFPTPADFRNWLEKNHQTETALIVGYYKVSSGLPSMSWPESVDEALCFGWIDGVRKSIDDKSYFIRFTPRKPGSIWSAINIRKVEDLIRKGLMHPAGMASFAKRQDHKSRIYSYEKEAVELSPDYEKKFKAEKAAWTFFQLQPPGYKKQMIHRIMDARQEKTRISRLQKLIEASKLHVRIP